MLRSCNYWDYLLKLSPESLELPSPDRGNLFRPLAGGSTPLIVAAEHGSVRSVRYLLQKGANIHARRTDNPRALKVGVINGSSEVVALLLEASGDADISGPDLDECLLIAAKNKQIKILRSLLRAGADGLAQDENGKTALTLAVKNAHPASVACLLENGVDANGTDSSYKPALIRVLEAEYMRFYDRYLITELLLSWNATIDRHVGITIFPGPVLMTLLSDNGGTVDTSAYFQRLLRETKLSPHQPGSFDPTGDYIELLELSRTRQAREGLAANRPRERGYSRRRPLFYFIGVTRPLLPVLLTE